MEDTIYLDPDDDIASIIGKLEKARTPLPSMVVPRGHKVFRDAIHVGMLWRQIEQIDRPVLVITKDRGIRELAREQGFRVVSSLRKAGFNSRPVGLRFWAWNWRRIIIGVSIAILILVPSAYAVFYFVPSTEVVLTPVAQQTAKQIAMIASPATEKASVADGTIPARPLENIMETDGQIATSGAKKIPDKAARARVTFLNKTGEPIVVPQGTRVSTSNDIYFRATADAVLPAGDQSRASVDVVAESPGAAGNVLPLAINRILEGQLNLKLTVFNEEAATGGSDKDARLVSEDDRQRLRQKVMDGAKADALAQMEGGKGEGETILPDSLVPRILDEQFDAQVGEERPVLGLKAKLAVRGLAVETRDLEKVVVGQVQRATGDQTVYLIRETLQAQMIEAKYVGEDKLAFQIYAKGKVIYDIDKSKLQKAIVGLPEDDAKRYLASVYPLAAPPEITVSPAWFGTVSRMASRIKVQIRQAPDG